MKFQPEVATIASWLLFFFIHQVTCAPKNLPKVSFNPSKFNFTESDSQLVRITINSTDVRALPELRLDVKSLDEAIVTVTQSLSQFRDRSSVGNFSITLTANKLGRTSLAWRLYQMPGNKTIDSGAFDVSVSRKSNKFQDIFLIIAAIFVTGCTFVVGCLIDLEMVKNLLKEPLAPIISLTGQFVLMPLASFLAALVFFPSHVPFIIGLVTIGCCPSGVGSNLWTFLFNGDVHLSFRLTLVSTFAAVVAMPIWMLILGRISLHETETKISFVNLLTLLLFLTFSLTTGVAFRKISPSMAKFLEDNIKTLSSLAVAIFVVGAVCLSWNILALFTLKIILALLVVTLVGAIFCSIVASVFKLPGQQLISLSMETSLPNSVVAFVLLQILLNHPDSDLAIVPVVGQLFISAMALCIAFLINYTRRRTLKPNSRVELMDTCKDGKDEQKDIKPRDSVDDIEFGIPPDN